MAGKQGLFDTDEEFIEHIEMEHDLAVRREDETEEQALARVKAKNPRIGTKDCRCPSCMLKRMAEWLKREVEG